MGRRSSGVRKCGYLYPCQNWIGEYSRTFGRKGVLGLSDVIDDGRSYRSFVQSPSGKQSTGILLGGGTKGRCECSRLLVLCNSINLLGESREVKVGPVVWSC